MDVCEVNDKIALSYYILISRLQQHDVSVRAAVSSFVRTDDTRAAMDRVGKNVRMVQIKVDGVPEDQRFRKSPTCAR